MGDGRHLRSAKEFRPAKRSQKCFRISLGPTIVWAITRGKISIKCSGQLETQVNDYKD